MSSPRVVAGSARGRRLRGACPERSEWVPGDKTRPIALAFSVIASLHFSCHSERERFCAAFSGAARRGIRMTLIIKATLPEIVPAL